MHHQAPSNHVALTSEQQWHDHGAKAQELLSKWQVDSFLKFHQLWKLNEVALIIIIVIIISSCHSFCPLNYHSPIWLPSNKQFWRTVLCLNIRLCSSDVLLELQEFRSKLDVGLQEVLSIHAVGLSITGMLLNIQPNSSSWTTCSRKSNDDTRSVGELNIQTLVWRNATIEISVWEVACISHGAILPVKLAQEQPTWFEYIPPILDPINDLSSIFAVKSLTTSAAPSLLTFS